MPRKMRLHINGFDFVINTDENPEYIRELTAEVNERIDGLTSKNSTLSVAMVGMLAALEFADDAKKMRIDADNLRLQLKNFVDETAKARLESDSLQKQINALKKEIERLQGGDDQTKFT